METATTTKLFHTWEIKKTISAALSSYSNNVAISNLFKMLQFEEKNQLAAFLTQVRQELIQVM